jgi:ABC-type Fe3+-hydroxamate transport system substrate-binding protein
MARMRLRIIEEAQMAALRILDDRQRELLFLRPPQRIVSLVPSDTLNVRALGAGERLVGRTRYCDAPESVPLVGGTKDVDVDVVARLMPDLILANQEENSRSHLEELAQLGFPLLVSFPRTVAGGLSHLARLAKVLEVDGRDLLRRGYAAVQEAEAALRERRPLRAFVPIWMDPLMTVNGQTYMSDAIRLGGGENVFADRQRRYPLAADLGQAIPRPAGTRDTRYPRVTLEEVAQRGPGIVLLPDEPHPFSAEDAEVFRRALPSATRVVRCGGRDFSWYGAQGVEGVPRLRALIDSLR